MSPDETAELTACFWKTRAPILCWLMVQPLMRRSNTALRMLKRYPEIARHCIHTAVVCGDLEQVERKLSQKP